MRKIFTLLAILLTTCAFAQKGRIAGRLTDTAGKQSLQAATVNLLDASDSTLVKFSLAKQDGAFEFTDLDPGKYLVQYSFQGYFTGYKAVELTASRLTAELGNIYMRTDANALEGVVVTSTPPIVIKGDTAEFNAGSFKTKPNATAEDLLKKLPGVEVGKDGTVTAQGEQVKKIYVDGKEFFGDDPKMATKNLPSDVIDKIQLYDAQSDQSQFTGFDDGNRTKSINIITKKDKRHGYFGKASAGMGTNKRYAVDASLNQFNGNRQISYVGQFNNINKQNFSGQDLVGSSGNRGGLNNNLTSSTPTGIQRTWSSGLNFNDQWGAKTTFNGSYFYNDQRTENIQSTLRETYIKNSTSQFNEGNTTSITNNKNHRASFRLEHQFDSSNSILVRPSFSQQTNNNDYTRISQTTLGQKTLLNKANQVTGSQSTGYTFNNSILLRHKFKKRGRTISLNLTQALNNTTTNSSNLSNNTYVYNGIPRDSTIDQLNDIDRDGKTFGGTLSYTEPIGRKGQLEVNYSYNNNQNVSDKLTNNYNRVTGKYDLTDTILTNRFENSNISHRVNVNYRRQISNELSYMLGIGAQNARLESDNITRKTYLNNNYWNYFPMFMLQYRQSRTLNLRLRYNGSTSQPSATQLQDALNNSDPLNQSNGNPALKQSFSHNLNLFFNKLDMFTSRNMFAGVNASLTQNQISNQIITNIGTDSVTVDKGVTLGPGARYTKPINLNGGFSLSGFFNYSFPLKKPKSNINLGTNLSYTRGVNLNRNITNSSDITDVKNVTNNYAVTERIGYTINVKERFDMNFSSYSTFNFINYSQSPSNNANYYTQRFSVEPTYSTPSGWIVEADFDYTFYRGQAAGFNPAIPLLNASIAKTFLKNKAAEIRLTVFDLLKENKSITTTPTDNYILYTNSNVLQQYFMLTFTYNLRNFGGRNMPGFFGNGRGGGGGNFRRGM
jgi:hypothetical protein